jgi:imidazolonepropionase-like amidohydrolase
MSYNVRLLIKIKYRSYKICIIYDKGKVKMYFLIHNGTLIDGNGGELVYDGVVLIKNNEIVSIGTENSLKLPQEKIKRIDAQGGYILPGFIDVHSHLMLDGFMLEDNVFTPLSYYFYKATENLKLTLNAGITSVRDAGMADFGVKQALEDNVISGPKIQICVMPLSITGGHFDLWLKSGFDVRISYPGLPSAVCDGEAEVRKRAREVLRAGAEVLKVMVTGGVMSANDNPEHPQFTVEELKVIVDEANCRGVKVMAHAHGAEGINNAVHAGVESIEHGTYLDREAIRLMLDKGTWLVPTLLVNKYNREKAELGGLPDYSKNDAIKVAKVHQKNMKKAYKSGIPILMGTDCGIAPHGQNLKELGLLCELGMSSMEAIQAGTKKAAECLGWQDNIGTLEKGKLADIVICNTDPVEDIKSLGNPQNIKMVLKNGTIVKDLRKPELDL